MASTNRLGIAGTAALLLVLALAGGCRDGGKEGGFFAVSGKLFIFNYRVATATYLVTLAPLQPMDGGQTVVATFEDPQGGAPIVVRQKVWPQADKVTLQSPPLLCVRKDRPYAVSIRVEDAAGAARQVIETTMTSSEDQSILPDEPLVVGPVYTPNPDLAGRPGGKLPEAERPKCPT
jgi:hypothetical protein